MAANWTSLLSSRFMQLVVCWTTLSGCQIKCQIQCAKNWISVLPYYFLNSLSRCMFWRLQHNILHICWHHAQLPISTLTFSFYFYYFFKKGLIYLKDKVTEREEAKKGRSFICRFFFKWLQPQSLGQEKARCQDLHLDPHEGGRDPSMWTNICFLSTVH